MSPTKKEAPPQAKPVVKATTKKRLVQTTIFGAASTTQPPPKKTKKNTTTKPTTASSEEAKQNHLKPAPPPTTTAVVVKRKPAVKTLRKVSCQHEGCTDFIVVKKGQQPDDQPVQEEEEIKWLCSEHGGPAPRCRCLLEGCGKPVAWNNIACCNHLPKFVLKTLEGHKIPRKPRKPKCLEDQSNTYDKKKAEGGEKAKPVATAKPTPTAQPEPKSKKASPVKPNGARKSSVLETWDASKKKKRKSPPKKAESKAAAKQSASRVEQVEKPEPIFSPKKAAAGVKPESKTTAKDAHRKVSVLESLPQSDAKKAATIAPTPPQSASSNKRKSRIELTPEQIAQMPHELEGPPDDVLPNGATWPPGWIKRQKLRKNGKVIGRYDCYWITPLLHKQLRSLKEVERFLILLEERNNHEAPAWAAFQQQQKEQKQKRKSGAQQSATTAPPADVVAAAPPPPAEKAAT